MQALKRLFQLNTAIGIGVDLNTDGSMEVQACEVTVKNNRLNFGQKITCLKSLQELARHFPANAAVSVNLNGKGILQKQVDKMEAVTPANFSRILPNASLKDFYVQHFVSGAKSFVSLMRTEEAEKVLDQLRDLGYEPVQLSFGPFPVETILPQLNVYGSSLLFAGHHAELNEAGEWLSYQYTSGLVAAFPFKIEQEVINEKLLTAYAGAFQMLFGDRLETVKAGVPELDLSYRKLLSAKKLKVAGMMVLFVFFGLLLINFLTFSYFDGANKELAGQVDRSAQSRRSFGQIENEIKTKEALLQELGWDGGANKAIILDQLAASLPQGITWKELSVNPIDINASRHTRTLVFADRQIQVTGSAGRVLPLNEWMAALKEKDWVKSVRLESYAFQQEDLTGRFVITIKY